MLVVAARERELKFHSACKSIVNSTAFGVPPLVVYCQDFILIADAVDGYEAPIGRPAIVPASAVEQSSREVHVEERRTSKARGGQIAAILIQRVRIVTQPSACGDDHFRVRAKVNGGRSWTTVKRLDCGCYGGNRDGSLCLGHPESGRKC